MKHLLICFLLTGCATTIPGVEIDNVQRANCQIHRCTVWSDLDLQQLILEAMRQGYALGRKSL